MKRTGNTVFYVLMLLIILISLPGCGAKSAATPTPQGTLSAVKSENRLYAEGTVVPVNYATINFASAGVIREILVNEGDSVKKDEIIARLDGTEKLQASATAAELNLLTAKQALNDLNRDAEVDQANAQLALANAEKVLDDAKDERDRKNYSRASQATIDAAQANYILAKQDVEDAEENFSYVVHKAEDDPDRAALMNVLANARQKRDRALANLDWLLGRPDAIEVAQADGKVAVARANVEAAKKKLERVKGGPDSDQLALAESRVKNAEAQVASARDALSDLELRAPFDGIVVTSNLKVGEIAGTGTGIPSPVSMADTSQMKVKTTDLTELNVVDITPGMPAVISLDALPGVEFNGTVERINALGENKQGDITYTVYITLDQQDPRLRWNMTAQVVFKPQE